MTTTTTKQCKHCNQEKPIGEFQRVKLRDGTWCRVWTCNGCRQPTHRGGGPLDKATLIRLRHAVGLDADGKPLPGRHSWGWPR